MTDEVVLDRSRAVGTITLNRPNKLNALTPRMYELISDGVRELDADPDIRVLVLRGEGRAFSAGYDMSVDEGGMEMAEREHFMRDISNGARWGIWNCTKPVIAQVHGYCLGAAFELVMPADFTIATPDCQLGEPEITLGYGVGFLMLPWLVGPKTAKDLLLTGRRIRGDEAAAAGLVTRAVAADDIQTEVAELATHLAGLPPLAMAVTKRAVNRSFEARGIVPTVDASVDSTLYLYAANREAQPS